MFNIYIVSTCVISGVQMIVDSAHSLHDLAEKRVQELLNSNAEVYIQTYLLDGDAGNGPTSTERFSADDLAAVRGNA